MADKKKAGVSVVPEFVAGEQPTADKFNAIGVQLERAASELEKAVGDIWGESWPYSDADPTKLTLPMGRDLTDAGALNGADSGDAANGAFLDIPNVARLIGPASNLNPDILSNFGPEPAAVPGSSVYVATIAGEQLDTALFPKREFHTKYRPDNIIWPYVNFTGSGAIYFLNQELNHENVKSHGDWCIDTEGRLTVWTPVPAGATVYINYTTKPVSWGTGSGVQGSTFNVIPDPNQIFNGGAGCTATLFGDSYIVTLPTATYGKSSEGVFDEESVTVALDAKDVNYNKQLYLPKVLQDNFTTGETIPEGFLYIRDNSTGKIHNDAVYIYNTPNTIQVKNVTLDTASSFSIITIGATITGAIRDLRWKANHHRHDGRYGEPQIHIKDIIGIYEQGGGGIIGSPTTDDKGPYVKSLHPGNWMPQYLHRDGYVDDESDQNDKNAMRGTLVLGRTNLSTGVGTPGTILQTTPDNTARDYSYGIVFGGKPGTMGTDFHQAAPAIWQDNGSLKIKSKRGFQTGAVDSAGCVNIHGSGNVTIDAGGKRFAGPSSVYPTIAVDGALTSDGQVPTLCLGSEKDIKMGTTSGQINIDASARFLARSRTNNAWLISDTGNAYMQATAEHAHVKAAKTCYTEAGHNVNIEAGMDVEIIATDHVHIKGNASGITLQQREEGPAADIRGLLRGFEGTEAGNNFIIKSEAWWTGTSKNNSGLRVGTEAEANFYVDTVFSATAPKSAGYVAHINNAIKDEYSSNTGGGLILHYEYRGANSLGYDQATFLQFQCDEGKTENIDTDDDIPGGLLTEGGSHGGGLGSFTCFPRTDEVGGWWTEAGFASAGGYFYNPSGNLQERPFNGAVVFVTGGSDFGEFMLAGDPEEWADCSDNPLWDVDEEKFKENINIQSSKRKPIGLPEGTLVWVRSDEENDYNGARFWKYGPGRAMLVTRSMAVAGNALDNIALRPYECVSFIGQIQTAIKGPAKMGDLIIPAEHTWVTAVDPAEISFDDYKSAIGTILSKPRKAVMDDGSEWHQALVAVGVK